MIQWHRLVGLALKDTFYKTAYKVEVEKDLSEQQQFLDVLIVQQKKGKIPKPETLPDGLNHLNKYNLITFKSFRESLTQWSMKELIGHYVDYRKLIGEKKKLPSETKFNLYAVTALKPHWLKEKKNDYKKIQDGIYKITILNSDIKIIVTKQLPKKKANALWYMFTGIKNDVKYGINNYKIHNKELSNTLYNTLCEYYSEEKIMSYTVEDFQKDYVRRHIKYLEPNEVLANYTSNEVLANYTSNEVLANYTSNEVLTNYTSNERLDGISINERLKDFSKEDIQKFLTNMDISQKN